MANKKQNNSNTKMPMQDGQMMGMTIEEAERMMREQHGDVREMERGKMMNKNKNQKGGK